MYVHGFAAAFLVVQSEMLNVADDTLRLHATNQIPGQRSRKDGVFALVLERAPVAGLAREVNAPAQ